MNPDSNSTLVSGGNLSEDSSGISFNNQDEILSSSGIKSTIEAPKNIEHLEEIQKSKEYFDDDDDDEDYQIPRLKIGDTNVDLDELDVHNVNDKVKIEPDVILDDVEILS